jgi:hypothetical protein
MRHVHTGIGILAAMVIVALSAFMNYKFWFSMGSGPDEGHAMGAVSVVFDVLKALLPVWIATAVAQRRWIYAMLATPIFALLLAGSLLSAFGFVNSNRSQAVGGREATSEHYAIKKRELADLNEQLSRLSGYPPTGTVEANLASMRQDKRWASSNGCQDATAPASRDFCKTYETTRGQLESASEAHRLSSKRDEVQAEVTRLLDTGANEEADPQAGFVAKTMAALNFHAVDAKTVIVLLFAVLAELCAAFGLFLATRHSPTKPTKITTAPSQQQSKQGYPDNVVSVPSIPRNALPRPRRRALGSGFPVPTHARREVTDLEPDEPRRFVADEAARQWSSGR